MQQNRLVLPVVLLFSLTAGGIFAAKLFREQQRIHTLVLATASRNGEYYAFGQALAKVLERHHSNLKIDVLATQGSLQNMQLLEEQSAQLALAQSDIPATSSARAVASLFPELFHLLVAANAEIARIPDLRGKRIALMPEGSGSYKLFWPLIEHYGLQRNEVEAIALPAAEANQALSQGRVDALFRIIAQGNPAIGELLQTRRIQILPIDQAAALQLKLPYLEAIQIPKGTYNGALPNPAEDLPVIAVRSLLLTHSDVNPEVIYTITQALYELRSELVAEYPQAATLLLPEARENLGLPLHPGARAYYNQDRPSFLIEYAEPIGLGISVFLLSLSGLWQLRTWLIGRQKNRADQYNLQLLELIDQIQECSDLEHLAVLRQQLFAILRKVVVDLDVDRISPESFQSFTLPWDVAISALRHREILLTPVQPPRVKPKTQ